MGMTTAMRMNILQSTCFLSWIVLFFFRRCPLLGFPDTAPASTLPRLCFWWAAPDLRVDVDFLPTPFPRRPFRFLARGGLPRTRCSVGFTISGASSPSPLSTIWLSSSISPALVSGFCPEFKLSSSLTRPAPPDADPVDFSLPRQPPLPARLLCFLGLLAGVCDWPFPNATSVVSGLADLL